jgi:hypothetical protein
MQDQHPADGGIRLRRICEPGQAEPVSGRLFLCVSCRRQVVICRCCDRGQIYCDGDCSRRARLQSKRAAARRYQASLPGRRTHAVRMGRYRARQQIVTHHSSPPPPADDLLPAGAIAATTDNGSPVERPHRRISHCHWCGRPCLPQLRQGFLRRRDGHRYRAKHAGTESRPPW